MPAASCTGASDEPGQVIDWPEAAAARETRKRIEAIEDLGPVMVVDLPPPRYEYVSTEKARSD